MSASALLDELMAGFAPTESALSDPTPAKVANPANRKHPCGLAADAAPCEGLRKVANPGPGATSLPADSQKFAVLRNLDTTPQSKQRRGSSQDSQDSQGYPGTKTISAHPSDGQWDDGDIARFLDRRARLLRWGWPEPDAEDLAERLVRRDQEHDDRVSCADCAHYRPGRCGNHRGAALQGPEVGRDLVAMLQRCNGFQSGG